MLEQKPLRKKKMENQNRIDTWIQIIADPHAKMRGFSILNLEFKADVVEPVQGEMKDFTGKTMQGMFWVVSEDEVFRVCPQLRKFRTGDSKPWFFPQEFCKGFYRPYYFRRTKFVDLTLTPPDPDPKVSSSGLILGNYKKD